MTNDENEEENRQKPAKVPLLTDKQKLFADHYFMHQSPKEAALHAGYSAKSASVEGTRLRKNPKVQAYLEQKAESAFEDKNLSLVDINKELSKRTSIERETLKHFHDIKDPKSPTKYKYWELYLKVKGHLNENKTQNLFISTEGQALSHDEIMKEAKRIMQKVHTNTRTIEIDPINKNDDS